jgi:hypothetical protein
MTTREARQEGAAPPATAANVIRFERRRPKSTSTAPEALLHRTEATLRAADVNSRLLIDRLETARRTGDRSRLGAVDGAALLHVAVVAETFQRVAFEALAQVDRELARRALLIAEAASEVVPGGGDPE